MNDRYADLKIVTSHRGTTTTRPATPNRPPRQRKPLASLAADKTAVAQATSRIAHGGGRTVKAVAFNASV